VKLKLNEWSKLGQAERRALVDKPCGTAAEIDGWRAEVNALVAKACGAAPSILPELPEPLWDHPILPIQVRDKAAEEGLALTDAAWAALSPLQRFALTKLSRPGHENRNFRPALKEFGLLPG
jgi:hypothetical protein